MPTFTLDGKEIPFQPGETIITAAWKHGVEVPHYCWHPGLSIAANCRMCLVEIAPPPNQRPVTLDVLEWDAALSDYRVVSKPKLQPACQVAAAEGMKVAGDSSSHVQQARSAVQEFLLLNHPVDCPICDQAGECKLQDYWLDHGRFQKRRAEEPVHKPKAVVFGPTIVYDAERCVMCTRCIRFMDEVAKDPVLEMRERGNITEIIVAPGRELRGHYTMMTEHVCPVGALTTKDFRFKARVWFLRTAKSVCQGCARGCNAYLDYDPRQNKAHRYRPRDNEQVNQFWMCDDGMLSYRAVAENRLQESRIRSSAASRDEALAEVSRLFVGAPPSNVAVLYSSQHSLEDNWALRELGKVLLGTTNAYVAGAAEGHEDAILIHKDKNSNALGVAAVAPEAKPFASLLDDVQAGRITHVIALGSDVPGGAQAADALRNLKGLVVVATHRGPLAQAAHVSLPGAAWAEAHGTYVNCGGLRQNAEKALEPVGAAEPGWQWLAALATSLGLHASWGKLKEVRTRLAAEGPQAPLAP